jgi:hypothetical protein
MQTFSIDLLKIEEFVQLNGRDMIEVGCGDGRLFMLIGLKVLCFSIACLAASTPPIEQWLYIYARQVPHNSR